MLKTSPSSQTMMNCTDSPSALPRRKFSRICGEKTTTQHAIDMELATVRHYLLRIMGGEGEFVPANARDGLDVKVEGLCRRRHVSSRLNTDTCVMYSDALATFDILYREEIVLAPCTCAVISYARTIMLEPAY